MAETDAPRRSPGPGPGTRAPAEGPAPLSQRMAGRSGEIATRWIEALDRHGSPPSPFSGRARGEDVEDVEDGSGRRRSPAAEAPPAEAHRLVEWITGSDPGQIPREAVEALEALLDRNEDRDGRSEGDLSRELLLLCRVLYAVLEEEAATLGDRVRPTDVASEAGRLSRAVLLAAGVVGDLAEQRRRVRRQDFLDRFASMVRHEMRNPLGAAQAAAQLLREDGDDLGPEQFQRVLTSLERSVRHALDVLVSVTALSHAESREVERWESADEVLRRVVEMARERAGDDVAIELSPALPSLLVDGPRVELVTHNLVENGVKYRDPGKDRSWVRVEVDRDDAGGLWWIRVRDNGIGVAPAEQERIFEHFFRSGGEGVEGTGQGLAIAREAARQMDGRLEVESTPGVGSVFSLGIPDERTRAPG